MMIGLVRKDDLDDLLFETASLDERSRLARRVQRSLGLATVQEDLHVVQGLEGLTQLCLQLSVCPSDDDRRLLLQQTSVDSALRPIEH